MKKYNGFTLVELMTVIAIIGIITLSTADYIGSSLANSASKGMARTMRSDFDFARSHAVSSSTPITVTILPVDQTTGGSTNWALGWTVWDSSNTEAPIRSQTAFRNGTTITSDTFDKDNPIIFTSTGTSTTPGTLTALASGCVGENGRVIQITQIGQTIISNTECPQG